MASYIEIDMLNQLTGEGAVVSAATIYVEPTGVGDRPINSRTCRPSNPLR